MIDPLVSGILAKTAVDFLFPKVAEGALQAVGSDAYKGALKKLKGFFAYKFGDRPEFDKGEADPEALTTLVTQSLESSEEMRKDLAQLVAEVQKLSAVDTQSSSQVMQGNEGSSVGAQNSGNIDQSRTSFGNVNVSTGNGKNSSNVNIGNRGDSFQG